MHNNYAVISIAYSYSLWRCGVSSWVLTWTLSWFEVLAKPSLSFLWMRSNKLVENVNIIIMVLTVDLHARSKLHVVFSVCIACMCILVYSYIYPLKCIIVNASLQVSNCEIMQILHAGCRIAFSHWECYVLFISLQYNYYGVYTSIIILPLIIII